MISINSSKVLRRSQWIAGVLLGCLGLVAAAQAQATARNFDIPAQRAPDGVKALAQQAGLQIAALSEDLGDLRTNAVHGVYEPMEALQQLIAGTGLEINSTGGDAVTIRRVALADQAAPTAPPAEPATAQSASPGTPANSAQTVEEVVVTGSRIKRTGFDTLQAASVTTGEEIDKRGYNNVGDALAANPGVFLDNGTVQTTQGQQSIGQTFVNLFGLGSQRTLTLVNGRRYVSSNSPGGSVGSGSQVDMNLMPVGMIERVETVAIGGAPVYGSDAIAGTVNVILKDNFEGFEFGAQRGQTERGDADSDTYRVLMGTNFSEGRGNFMLGASYNKQDGLLLADRFGRGFDRPNPADTSDTDGISAQRIFEALQFGIMTDGGLPYDPAGFVPGVTDVAAVIGAPGFYPNGNWVFDSSGNPLIFGPTGDLVPYNFGAQQETIETIPFILDGGDGLDFSKHMPLLSPTKRVLVNGTGHYDITPSVRAFVETAYAHTEAIEQSEIIDFNAPFLVGGPVINLSATNPFLTQQARETIAANGLTQFSLNRHWGDVLDTNPPNTEVDVYRVVGGFEGELPAFGDTWNWNIAYNYGRSHNRSELNFLIEENLLNALDAVRDPGTGEIVCASAATNSNCVALNPFGVNNFSSAAAAYVTQLGTGLSVNTMKVLNANLAGHLPFGISEHIAFNFGLERRKEEASFDPDPIQEAGRTLTGQSIAFTGIEGEFDTKEAYTELVMPIISDSQGLRGVKALSIEGAARYVDHSLAGTDTTWSAGGRFSPRLPGWGDGFMFRGVFTHSIRAPNIAELFSGAVPSLNTITDICNATNFNEGLSPTVREANCRAALAAVGASPPETFDETTDGASPAGTLSGNPNLNNETADSWSVGIVYQPTVVPRLRLALDWSNIELEGGIEALGIGDLMQACYDNANFPNVDACGAFHRLDAAEAAAQPGPPRIAGDVADGYNSGYINTTSTKFAALTFDAAYSFDLKGGEAGTVRLGTRVYHVDQLDTLSFAGTPLDEAAGLVGQPDYRANFNVGYTLRKLDLDLQAQWTDKVIFDRTTTIEDFPFNSIDAYTLMIGTVGYRLTDQVKLQLTVQNLLDEKIPFEARVSELVSTYDAIGRRYFLSLYANF